MGYSNDVLAITSNSFDARWNAGSPIGTPVIVTFSFGDNRATYDNQQPNAFTPWNEQARAYVRQAFQVWDQASGIHFIEIPDSVGGQIRVTLYDMTGLLNSTGQQASGFGYYPRYQVSTINGTSVTEVSYNNLGGDLFLNSNFYASNPNLLAPGQRGFSIALHEIGHTIGFKHPFEGVPTIDPSHDNGAYTILSYNRSNATTTLGSVDVEASQIYYGTRDLDFAWDASRSTLTVAGTLTNDYVLGTNLGDVLSAGAGNDTVRGGPGADTIDGGEGLDIAVFNRARASYTINAASSTVTVTALSGTDGADTLRNVERLSFADGTLALDLAGYAGQMYRLYQAAFNRKPDVGGLGYWIKEVDAGKGDLYWAAGNFIGSGEFSTAYGDPATLSSTALITLIYQNVLKRTPDAAGLSYWDQQIAGGVSKAQVLAGFSESAENQLNVASDIQNGIWFI